MVEREEARSIEGGEGRGGRKEVCWKSELVSVEVVGGQEAG